MIVAATKMGRSAHGLDSADDTPWWRLQVACRDDPDMWLGEVKTANARAVHICVAHCPVLDACRADTGRQTPVGGIQAGLRWTDSVTANRQGPTANQPDDPGHGHWCPPKKGRHT